MLNVAFPPFPSFAKCLVSAALLFPAAMQAQQPVPGMLRLSNAIQSGMVIQQEKPFKIRGWSVPGTTVTVKADWMKSTASAVVDGDSSFLVIIPVPSAVAGKPEQHRISITSGVANNSTANQTQAGGIELNDLLIGDVWFCGGQSNMQFRLEEDKNAAAELARADHPGIRLLMADLNFSATPLDDFKGKWKHCDSTTAKKFSAVGYSMGRDLHQALNIPIGLIFSGIGASAAQAWVPQEVLSGDTQLSRVYLQPYLQSERSREKIDGGFSFEKVTRPFLLYNAMIEPLRDVSLRGITWYQGESNRMERESYTHLMEQLIASWRQKLGQQDLPFYYVQVAPYWHEQPDSALAHYAFFREAQEKFSRVNNTAMVVTMDVGESRDLHPKNKMPIGHRLALTALNRLYGRDTVSYRGPQYDHIETSGAVVKVFFQPGTVDGGLETNDRKAPRYFLVAGADKRFHRADAKIEGNMIVLRSAAVKKPVAVRYAFTNFPVTNLQNAKGLPAVPFRSDSFAE